MQDLIAKKARFEPETLKAIVQLDESKDKKSEAERQKEQARTALDEYESKMIQQYHDEVNKILDRFGAAFRLATIEIQYVGRTPRVGYVFALRGKQIDPGSDKTKPEDPCFSNTLSSGDRNTLALAFFIAQIRNRTDSKRLIVIFDDPFTSLDSFRQSYTYASIKQIARITDQVIVMSHSLPFLDRIANKCEHPVSTLKLDIHNKTDSRINPMNLADEALSLVEQEVTRLRNCIHGEDKDHLAAVRAIRPLLEHYIRTTTPDAVEAGSGWLGSFLASIKASVPGSILDVYKSQYDDLDELNAYTAPYHHDTGSHDVVDEGELIVHARIALSVIGRL